MHSTEVTTVHTPYEQDILRLWTPWPDLTPEEIELYQRGYIDGDPGEALAAAAIDSPSYHPIDFILVYFALDGLFDRISGCACYQIAMHLATGQCEDANLVAAYCSVWASNVYTLSDLTGRCRTMSLAKLEFFPMLLEKWAEVRSGTAEEFWTAEYVPESFADTMNDAATARRRMFDVIRERKFVE